MKISDFGGKNICVLGYGREGKAVVAALEKHAPGCEITIADQNESIDINGKHWKQVGTGWLENLDKFDAIIKSPGIPNSVISHQSSVISKTTSSTQIFLDTIADRKATIIGVTGSKGKSTTSSLIYAIAKAAGKDALLLGNIGEPAIAHLDDVKEGTICVMEMSSYQLSDLTVSPHIAVVTSFFPDHLDYHGGLDAYKDAKKNITRHQTADDITLFNGDSKGSAEIAKEGSGRKIPFSADECPFEISETKLIGEHNLSNISAALHVAYELEINAQTALKAVKEFNGLPHRLQSLGMHHGAEWIDDAISTTPESTIAGLRALDGCVKIIILGGQDRGYQFDELARELIAQNIDTAILFPGSGANIRTAIEKADTNKTITLHDAQSMEEAVAIAKQSAQSPQLKAHSSIILLSTASPSYGMFKNFEDKGEQFQKYAQA